MQCCNQYIIHHWVCKYIQYVAVGPLLLNEKQSENKDLKDKNINGIISFIAEESDNKKIEKVINNMPFVSKMKYNNVAFIGACC